MTSRIAGRTELAEIAVTFHPEDDGYHGYSSMECANDVDPPPPREDQPTKPRCEGLLVESPDRNQDTCMSWLLRTRLTYGQTIRHQGGIQ